VVVVVVAVAVKYFAFTPKPVPSFNSVATAYARGDLDSAIKSADEILAQDPHNEQALLLKAISLAQKGSLGFAEEQFGTQALALANQVIAMDQKSDEAYRIAGYANEIMQKYDEAHADYAKAIGLNPKNAMAVADDAHAYDLQGQTDLAQKGYQQALDIDQTVDLANLGLGRIFVAQKKLDDAQTHFQNVLAHSKNVRQKAEAAYNLGVVAGMKNDGVSVAKFMKQATMFDPNFSLGFAGLGAYLFTEAMATSSKLTADQRSKLITDSLQDLGRAISLNKGQSVVYLQLGIELGALGKTADALTILNSGLKATASDITLTAPQKANYAAQFSALISKLPTRK
jgi:tetratricopeptide (TPR) repeat protein